MGKQKDTKNTFSLIGKFGINSIFFQTLLFLLVFSAAIVVSLLSYSYYTVRQNAKQQLELRTEGMLEKTMESVDHEFVSLNSQLRMLLNDGSLRAIMTAPDLSNDERNYNTVTQMESVKALNESISDIYFYIPTNQQILVSNGFVSNIDVISKNSDLFK